MILKNNIHLTQGQRHWLSVLDAGNRVSPERVMSVQRNEPANTAETKEVKRWLNWILLIGRAHPSFGCDQSEVRDSFVRFIPNGVTNAEIGQFHRRFRSVSFRERDEDVGRLQVAVDDPERMELIQS